MSQCQVRIVSATISSSVRMSAVKEMATTCTNSDSNSTSAPYMRMPPGGAKRNKLKWRYQTKLGCVCFFMRDHLLHFSLDSWLRHLRMNLSGDKDWFDNILMRVWCTMCSSVSHSVKTLKCPDTHSSSGASCILIAFHYIITRHKLSLMASNRSHNCFFIQSSCSAFQRVKLCNKLSEIGA